MEKAIGVSKMNILITGGTGLIGSALLEKLDSHQVQVLTRQTDIKASRHKLSYITDLNQVDFNQVDAVINLAGEPIVAKRWSDEQKERLCQSRWQITQNLVDGINSAQRTTPIRFISGSAVGFYGRQDQRPINESYSQTYPEFSHLLCQRWEQIALKAEQANTALLRTGIVLTKQGGALSKMLLPFKLGLGGPVASGQQMMPWIHIDDMVNAIIFLLENPELQGPFNISAPNPVSNREFSQSLAKALNRPCLVPMPEFALRLMMGEMADLLVYGQNAIPQRLLDSGFNFTQPKLLGALKQILS